ncbi:MAG: glycoside hydrolase family 16 protein [Bacteroidetes bacterium]|nr:MAG: glycoside hydrolase family 16 protein [Bacteroidota bacterium]
MKQLKYLSIIISIAVLIPVKIIAQTYDLVWSDEFEYTGLPDDSKWNYDVGGDGWGNNELQFYTNARTQNARVENGNLIIEAHKESYGGNNYTSARLITKNKGDWLYGKIDVRAKLPGGTGSWPAVWMLPTDWAYGGWPASGEIDIMEYVGYDKGVVHGTVHTEAYNHMLNTQKGSQIIVADAEDAFHIYSMEWSETKIYIFVDNIKYFTFYAQGDYKTWPFDQRFHLLLNIAVGGNWGGVNGVDDNIFPIRMEVDYVRVYQDKTLSLKPLENTLSIDIFPNPSKDMIFVKTTKEFSQVDFYSLSGKRIKTYYNGLNKSAEINISTLQQGVYLLKLRTDKAEIIGQTKFIKK